MDLQHRPNPTKIDERPWGRFFQYTHNETTTVKIIEVKPGEVLSDQRHQKRAERWVMLTNGAWVEIDGVRQEPNEGDELWIPQGTWHRIGAKDDALGLVKFLEIAYGEFDENDIERRGDKYGRAKSAF